MEDKIKLVQKLDAGVVEEPKVEAPKESLAPVIKPIPEPIQAPNTVKLAYPDPRSDRTVVILSNNETIELPLGTTEICIDHGLTVKCVKHYAGDRLIKTT